MNQKNTVITTLSLPSSLDRIIREMAAKEGLSISYAAARMLRAGIKAYKADPTTALIDD